MLLSAAGFHMKLPVPIWRCWISYGAVGSHIKLLDFCGACVWQTPAASFWPASKPSHCIIQNVQVLCMGLIQEGEAANGHSLHLDLLGNTRREQEG